jgi:hypothetical protein
VLELEVLELSPEALELVLVAELDALELVMPELVVPEPEAPEVVVVPPPCPRLAEGAQPVQAASATTSHLSPGAGILFETSNAPPPRQRSRRRRSKGSANAAASHHAPAVPAGAIEQRPPELLELPEDDPALPPPLASHSVQA